MMREKGGGGSDMESPVGGLQPGSRTPGPDYYALSGWQTHSPSGRLDLDTLPSRMLASVSPLSKSPFTAASLGRPPERAYSAGMETSLDRDAGLYNRSPLTAGYRGSSDLMYNGEQPSLPMPAYHSGKDAGYLGLTCSDGSGGGLYGRSVLENSLFNRGLSMASLQSNPALVPNYRSHLGSSGEDFSMERPLERKFVFGSSHAPNALLSSHPYNRLLENYCQTSEHVSGGGKSNLESSSAERTGTHYGSPLPSHVAFSTGSSYINRNSPLYPFSHLSSSFPPESYTSYASSLTHLSNYGQLSVPPPAHSRAHDALSQRSAFAEEENKQHGEGSASQPFDATMSREFNVPTPQWGEHASVSNPKKESSMAAFEGQAQSSDASVSDRQCKCYEDSPALPLPKEEDGLEQLMGSQFVAVGSQEKMVTVQNEPCEISRCNPCQVDASWNMSGMSYTQSTAALSSVNGTNSAGVNVNTNERFVQQPTGYGVNTSQNAVTTFLPGSQPAVFPAKFSSPVSTTNCSYSASRDNRAACQFSGPPGLYSGSNDSDVDTDLEEKLQQQASQTAHKDNRFVSVTPNTTALRNEGGFPRTVTSRSELTKIPQKESLDYDSSTSEYEPPSPYQEPVKRQKRGRKASVTVKRQTITTSFQEDLDDAHEVDLHSSKIKLTIKTEQVMAVPTKRATGGPKSRRSTARKRKKKKGGAQKKENLGGKRSNKTCPLCLKTFSRADSLTCHMRVHTGDRPYHCDQCSASYKVSSHLRDHIRSKHSDAKPFECEKCGKPFTYSTARRRHEKICGKDLAERVEYQCFTCNKGFVTAKGFSKHQEKCGIPNPDLGAGERMTYKCKDCRKVFDSLPSLDGHQRFFCGKTKNQQVVHFSCGECGKAFFRRNLYIIHMRHHAGGKPFKCVQCESSFYGKDSLKQHMERHKGNQKFKCSLCDAAFFLKRCLSLHSRRVHGQLQPYKCKECEWNFFSGYHLCRHLRMVHCQVKQFKYVLVGRGFSGASFWMKQRRWQPVRDQAARHHTCKFCSKSFTMREMHPHVVSEHPGVTLSEALSKRLARCGLCSKEFSCQETLRVHKLQHKGKKPFRCHHCDMGFMLKSVLRLHQRKHEDYQPHACPECKKTFRWNASVRQHMITHHGLQMENGEHSSKRFTCNMCGQQFKQQIFLNVHMKRHTAAMPNICSQCGKGFVDLRHLKLHMARHDGPKTFVCEKCGDVFSTRSRLYGHTRSRHTEQTKREWLCDECGKSLCRRDSLLKHMAVHAKNHDDLIPKKGRRKGSKLPRRREWRTAEAVHGVQSMTTSTPDEGMNSRFAVPANAYGMTEADLADLKPTNFIPPNLGASPSLGVIPSFAAAARFSTAPGFVAAPPSVNQQQPTPEQFNYQYHYNNYVNHNIPCPNGANH